MPIDISHYQKAKHNDPVKGNSGLIALLNKDISFGNGQLPDRKKEAFYNELSTLLVSGIDIKTALDLVTTSFVKPKDKMLFEEIKRTVIGGLSLSVALETTGRFTAYEYFSIKIGEETGKIGEVLGELAKYYKSKLSQRKKLIGALTYPILVLCTSLAAVFFMLKFVVPMFGDVFTRFGGKLPYITQLIINVSNGLDRYFYTGILLMISLTVLYFIYREHPVFKRYAATFLLKIPVVGELVRKVYLARFANTMRLLVSTDTPLLYALGLLRQMIGFYPINYSLECAAQDILKGSTLSESLAKHNFYPEKFIQLIRIAEEINQLEYFFGQLSGQYTEEVEHVTATLSSVLEPLIIIFLGLIVGVILIAMYLPMFQMSNSF